MGSPADVVVALIALGVLLSTAYRNPPAGTEALLALAASGAVLATGVLTLEQVTDELGHLVPVVLFLMAILVVAECCRSAGLFAAIGSRVAALRTPRAMFNTTFVVATLTTVALSLDATVVLVTPVVMAAAAAAACSPRPAGLICVRLANSASLLLPVANLTNLLALRDLDLSIGRFALLMAPVWCVVLAIEYVVHRVWFADALTAVPVTAAPRVPLPVPVFPLVVVGLMLVAFTASSWVANGVDPAWIAAGAAAVLSVRGLRRAELSLPVVLRSSNPTFALFVLSLGVVVAALGSGPLGRRLDDLVPAGNGLGALLVLAVIGAVLANLVNNLPATLLLVPLVAPLGTVPVLAALIGINLGSSMTWIGSLANLLWRRTVTASGGVPSSRDFHLVGLAATPAGILAGVVVLHFWAQLI